MPSLQLAPPELLDDAPFRITVERTVDASPAACWALLVDQTSWPSWFGDMKWVKAEPPTWTAPGDTRTVNVSGLKVEEQCISLIEEQEYAFAITKWLLPNAKRAVEGVRLEDVSPDADTPRTKLTYIAGFESTRLGKLSEPLLRKQMSSAWSEALTELGKQASR